MRVCVCQLRMSVECFVVSGRRQNQWREYHPPTIIMLRNSSMQPSTMMVSAVTELYLGNELRNFQWDLRLVNGQFSFSAINIALGKRDNMLYMALVPHFATPVTITDG